MVIDNTQKINQPGNREALQLWHRSTVEIVRDDTPDLSSRQLAILLTVAIDQGPHTVRGLADKLSISKPAICRALDSLSRFKLAQRIVDKKDRRNIFVIPTEKGIDYLASLSEMILNNLLELQ